MKKTNYTTDSVEFELSDKELRKAVMMYLHEKYQILGDNTSVLVFDDGGCKVITEFQKTTHKIQDI